MQHVSSESNQSKSVRTPMLIVRLMNDDEMAVRFWNIGGRQKFMTLLQRFCTEFLLARAEKMDGLDWRILMQSQKPEVLDFARRYGLRVVEE
jgi:hypothetical protein